MTKNPSAEEVHTAYYGLCEFLAKRCKVLLDVYLQAVSEKDLPLACLAVSSLRDAAVVEPSSKKGLLLRNATSAVVGQSPEAAIRYMVELMGDDDSQVSERFKAEMQARYPTMEEDLVEAGRNLLLALSDSPEGEK